jgi:hypothetical protein
MLEDYALPSQPSEGEGALAESLGAAALRSIDDAITKTSQRRWLKVASSLSDRRPVNG